MKQLHQEISEREARMRFVLSASGFGVAEWDFKSKVLKLDDSAVEILRLTDGWQAGSIDDLIRRFPKEDGDAFRSAILRVVASVRQVTVPLRVQEGEDLHHLEARMVAERGRQGPSPAHRRDDPRRDGPCPRRERTPPVAEAGVDRSLAAGIAHEINTPVQFVSDSVHFVNDAVNDLLELVMEHDRMLTTSMETGGVPREMLEAARERFDDADVEYLQEQMPKAVDRALDGLDRVATIVRS